MKAVTWHGKHDVRVVNVPDPEILRSGDALVKVSLTAICGSDLHLYNGYIPSMKSGDVIGHEFMGEVVDVGAGVSEIKKGDRVVVSAVISCGRCFHCQATEFALCDNTNPNASLAAKAYGDAPAAIFGFSHLFGGYDGGQAEIVRVPNADVVCLPIPDDLPDERVLFLSDIFPTGYQAAENAEIEPGDVVAVWGCGPVGQFAIRSAFLFEAERVIAIDNQEERLRMASEAGAEVLNFDVHQNVIEELLLRTGGRGPDRCIDCVGTEALGHTIGMKFDWAKQLLRLQSDRPNVLRQMFQACRKGGTISVPGVYGGIIDGINFGSVFNKGLTLRAGPTHMARYMRPLLERIRNEEIDPSFIITHRTSPEAAPAMYEMFKHKHDGCVKVVMKPDAYLA